MKNTFGKTVSVTLFGESHGPAIGAVIDGLPAGVPVDADRIALELFLRRPSGNISTGRREKDEFIIESGVFGGFTCGTPLCILIPNSDTKSADYDFSMEKASRLARPGHADFTAHVKYGGFEDFRGGGHFSGRLTAALVAAGAVVRGALEKKGIFIGTHIAEIADVSDRAFGDIGADISALSEMAFPVLDESAEERMKNKILEAANDGDSVGGVLETAVFGLPAGLGEPWFDTVEGILAHALFSVPAVKGVEFGKGFALSKMRGSEANDAFVNDGERIITETNNCGGILGGITTGAPLLYRVAVKPTPTIFKEQSTIDLEIGENTVIKAKGRHDPCIVHRAAAVINNLSALVLCDMLTCRYGEEWLKP
ncbi:MAG: chorismate synthase [Ruminococcaceae bacterium]|nr:chorismate synthase [Oscillospiraceae bacterium]